MLRDEGGAEADGAPSGRTVFCRLLCASLNTLLNVRPTVVIVHLAYVRQCFGVLLRHYTIVIRTRNHVWGMTE